MSQFFNTAILAPIPASYVRPSFPSLYWPFPLNGDQSFYLYRPQDIWHFTLFWTLLFYAAMHVAASGFALLIMLFGKAERRQPITPKHTTTAEKTAGGTTPAKSIPRGALGGKHIRHVLKHGRARGKLEWAVIWSVPIVFIITGGVEAFVAGSCVGGLLAAVHNSGNFKMSTWVPFVWGLINSLVLVLSSFAIQGAL